MSRPKKTIPPAAEKLLSAAFWLALFFWAYWATGQELLVPSPLGVLSQLGRLVRSDASWRAVLYSLGRTLLAFGLGVGVGCLLAVLTSSVRLFDILFRPALGAVRATPVSSFIILALVWLRSDRVPVLTGFLMVLPVVWANVSQGIAATDPQLLEMARCFRLGRWETIRQVYAPSVKGTLVAACLTSIGLCWKAVIAAEVLGVPKGAIGTQLYNSKIYLETDALFAWTIMVVALSMGLEWLFRLLVSRGEARHGHGA